MVSVLSERRPNRLLDPALFVGLPTFLARGAGMRSGHILSQYTADMRIVEHRIRAAPPCTRPIPAGADHEHVASMGINAALATGQILDNAKGMTGDESIAAAQALDFRDFGFNRGSRVAHGAVRTVVAHLDEDRPLIRDHTTMSAAVSRCEVLAAVKAEVGSLAASW